MLTHTVGVSSEGGFFKCVQKQRRSVFRVFLNADNGDDREELSLLESQWFFAEFLKNAKIQQ